MAQTINFTLDVQKLRGVKQHKRTYSGKSGEVEVTEMKLKCVPLKDPKVLKQTDSYTLVKTHFVVENKPKDADGETVYIGDGIQFMNKSQENTVSGSVKDIRPEDIPF